MKLIFHDIVYYETHLDHFHLHSIDIDHHGHECIRDLGLVV